VRTPEERFAGLLDFPFSPRYRELEGLRLAHLDEGDGPPVLLVHAEPTWSFLWRTVLPPLRDAGYRCVVPYHAGFGRSDKPTDIGWYSYDRHTANLRALVEERDLRGATVVVHDWGGPIASPRRSVVTRPRWSRAPASSSIEITDRHAAAGTGTGPRGGQVDPAGGAGDGDHPAVEAAWLTRHVVPLPVDRPLAAGPYPDPRAGP